ncbi:MAG: hypothetical protein V1821_00755 [bacterium]
MKPKFLILFAGAVGSSKTPIAHHLSYHLKLPIFSNDAIRTEVIEDIGRFDEREYLKRRDARLYELLGSGASFIYDASIDREWENRRSQVAELGYEVFIISLDLSRAALERLYRAKGYQESAKRLDELMNDHGNFIASHQKDIALHLNDQNFGNRLTLSLDGVYKWLRS